MIINSIYLNFQQLISKIAYNKRSFIHKTGSNVTFIKLVKIRNESYWHIFIYFYLHPSTCLLMYPLLSHHPFTYFLLSCSISLSLSLSLCLSLLLLQFNLSTQMHYFRFVHESIILFYIFDLRLLCFWMIFYSSPCFHLIHSIVVLCGFLLFFICFFSLLLFILLCEHYHFLLILTFKLQSDLFLGYGSVHQ